MTNDEIIWLATAIDCEGTMGLSKFSRRRTLKSGKISTYITYFAHLHVVNTNLEFIQKCSRLLQGTESIRSRDGSLGKKTVYVAWQRNRHRLLEVLKLIHPHLICKREICLRLIAWLKWYGENRVVNGSKRMSVRMTEETRDAMTNEYHRMGEFTRAVQPFCGTNQN